MLYPSANRDAAVFDDPDTFDISRSPNPHLAFGFGAHFCIGNQLARLELKGMAERLLAQLPDLHLTVDQPALPRRAANFISGIEEMPAALMLTTRSQPQVGVLAHFCARYPPLCHNRSLRS